jgi:hypothetical protein
VTVASSHERAAEGAALQAKAEAIYRDIGPAIEAAITAGVVTGDARSELIELRHELARGSSRSLGIIAQRLSRFVEPAPAVTALKLTGGAALVKGARGG